MIDLYNISNNGLQTPTLEEIIEYLTTQLKYIYGENIKLEQNTPDGQILNIVAQNKADLNEVLNYIYNSFDPEIAEGRSLDRDVAYHGVTRQAGSYTIVPITIIINQVCSLQGLDDNSNDPTGTGFTISDNSGNNFILLETQTLQVGTHTINFRAESIGEVQPVLNSITNIITPQLGVVSVNNGSAPSSIGVEEETDYNLRLRFNNTFETGAKGSFESIIAEIYTLDGVKSISGENNYTNSTSTAGTPAHSIWLIVQGGENIEIGQAIYKTINVGCGMRGNVSVPIKNDFGFTENMLFDRPTNERLYIMMDVSRKEASTPIDVNYLKTQLVSNLELKINQTIDASQINEIMYSINNKLVYTDIEISKDGINYYDYISNTNINYIFTLSTEDINITTINI